jgi:phage tail sheath gpL-like
MAGLGHLTPEIAKRELDFYGNRELADQVQLVHDFNMKKIVENSIDNTEFVKNLDNYIYGHHIS